MKLLWLKHQQDLSRLTDKELEALEASIPQGYHAV